MLVCGVRNACFTIACWFCKNSTTYICRCLEKQILRRSIKPLIAVASGGWERGLISLSMLSIKETWICVCVCVFFTKKN